MSVVLVTSAGKPVAGVPVVFIAQTDFGNSSLGKNFTGATGWAYLTYPNYPDRVVRRLRDIRWHQHAQREQRGDSDRGASRSTATALRFSLRHPESVPP